MSLRDWVSPFAPGGRLHFAAGDDYTPSTPSNKARAIEIARQVLRYEQSGITILPSETIILSREYLRSLGISER
jgi:hypothetical protein